VEWGWRRSLQRSIYIEYFAWSSDKVEALYESVPHPHLFIRERLASTPRWVCDAPGRVPAHEEFYLDKSWKLQLDVSTSASHKPSVWAGAGDAIGHGGVDACQSKRSGVIIATGLREGNAAGRRQRWRGGATERRGSPGFFILQSVVSCHLLPVTCANWRFLGAQCRKG